MKNFLVILVLVFGFSAAQADVWKWVDTEGNTHFVDTKTAIYTWVDEHGDVHYSDKPGHEDAVSVELVWVSGGALNEMQASNDTSETPEDQAEREQAAAYYCKRATEVYESYVNAPRLYRTNDSGEREYLSKEDVAKTIAETRAQKDEHCT